MGIVFVFVFVLHICVDGVSVGGQCAWCGQPVTCVIIHPFKHLEGHGWVGFCSKMIIFLLDIRTHCLL